MAGLSVAVCGKHFIPLSLSTCLNSFLTLFHPDPCILLIQISLPDHPVLLATFPLGPFLCLHLLLGTLYLHTFVLLTSCPPLNTCTHMFNGLAWTTWVSLYQKGQTSLDFTEARDSEWQWHQLGHLQVCTSLQTDNHASTPLLSFLQAGCPSCRPTNSVIALKAPKIPSLPVFVYVCMYVYTV